MKINKCVLSNGLRVVHTEMNATQMVALNIIYDVGARDEHPQQTGLAHLMEHLMFSGSVNIPDYDSPLQNAGGENNAWTNSDITNFYLTVPYQNVETAFWLESDRMLGLAFNEHGLEVQRSVVIEEFKQRYLNQPYGDTQHLLRTLAYKVHPYQWPVIGKQVEHIADVKMQDVIDFYHRFYAPDNAILAVTGHISWADVQRLCEKWFAPIPRRHDVVVRNLPQEPVQTEERRLCVERPVPVDALYMSFHMVSRTHPDYPVYDALSDLLSHGNSSRLVRNLVIDNKVFSSIDASVYGTIDPGLLQITGQPADGVSLEQAEEAIWQQLQQLCNEPMSAYELDKVKNKFESAYIFGNINYLNVAMNLAWFELTGDVNDIDVQVDLYRAVTSESVQRVAREGFRRTNASVVYYKKQQ